jgi:hypothetical protein
VKGTTPPRLDALEDLVINSFRSLLLTALLAAAPLFASGLTGNLSGSLIDPSGSVIPGAEVSLTNIAVSQVRTMQSDSTGNFVFTHLLLSTYKLQGRSKGFKRCENDPDRRGLSPNRSPAN